MNIQNRKWKPARFVIALLAALFVSQQNVSSESSSNNKKYSVNTVNNLVDVKEVIQKYEIEEVFNFSKENYIYKTSNTPQFKDFKITELIMGLNRDTHDSIFYISFEHPNKNKMQFVHLSINGEISSSLKLKGQAEPSYFYKPIFPSSYDGSYKYGESETFEDGMIIQPMVWTQSLTNIKLAIDFLISIEFALNFHTEGIPELFEIQYMNNNAIGE